MACGFGLSARCPKFDVSTEGEAPLKHRWLGYGGRLAVATGTPLLLVWRAHPKPARRAGGMRSSRGGTGASSGSPLGVPGQRVEALETGKEHGGGRRDYPRAPGGGDSSRRRSPSKPSREREVRIQVPALKGEALLSFVDHPNMMARVPRGTGRRYRAHEHERSRMTAAFGTLTALVSGIHGWVPGEHHRSAL